MRILTTILALLLPAMAASAAPVDPPTPTEPRAEFALTYNWVHTNAPPADCGCFSMNGGSLDFAWRFTRTFSVVAEEGAVSASNVDGSNQGLILFNAAAGPRYTLPLHSRFKPFGQVLVGAVHADAGLSPGKLAIGSNNAFSMLAGGGLDVRLSPHFALRAIQADYFLTMLNNRADDRQNNARISAGIVYRFGN